MGCKSISYNDGFSLNDLQLELEIFGDKNCLEGKLICKNVSNKKIRLPKFYFMFNNENDYLMKNNWLSICDEKNIQIEYQGNYYDPYLKSLKSNVLVLKPKESYEMIIHDINKNYDIGTSKILFISYLGPLGKSNEIEYLLE